MSSPSLRIRQPRLTRLLPVTIVAAAAALALTGCEPGALAPTDSPEPSTSSSPQPTEAGGATPQPSEPDATETPEVTTPPVAGELPCSSVYTADQLYEFNANFAPSSDAGTLPGAIADIADAGGTVCAYQHVTGPDRLVVGVLPGLGEFDAVEFETVGDEGVASRETDGGVVSVASIYFASAQDAQQVLDQVAANVG